MVSDLKVKNNNLLDSSESQKNESNSFSDTENIKDPLNYLNAIKLDLDTNNFPSEKEVMEEEKTPESSTTFWKKMPPLKARKIAAIGILGVLIGSTNLWNAPNSSEEELKKSKLPIQGKKFTQLSASKTLSQKLQKKNKPEKVIPKLLDSKNTQKEILSSTKTQETKTSSEIEYKVVRGDSLYKIAEKKLGNGVYASYIAQHNGIAPPYNIQADQTIKIPVHPNTKSKASTKTPKNSEKPVEKELLYKVQTGDSLYKIAERKLGSGLYTHQLAEYNNLEDPSKIRVGQLLKIPAEPSLLNKK